jgi:hypothetical protein
MNKPCILVKCERCGSESLLMQDCVRSNTILCPVCTENEINCCLITPETKGCRESDNVVYNSYLYVTDSVALSTN